MALPDTWLRTNDGRERAALEERTDRDGLAARITPKGKITFQIRLRYDGRQHRLDIGSYPAMSLKEARAETLRLNGRAEQGHDPRIVRLLEKQAILKADSVQLQLQIISMISAPDRPIGDYRNVAPTASTAARVALATSSRKALRSGEGVTSGTGAARS